MRKNKSTLIWTIVITVVLTGLFLLPRLNNPFRQTVVGWENSGVDCLDKGHTRLAQHIHSVLAVTVNGETEAVPADIGIVPTCMAEVHTHDLTGEIHIESVLPYKKFTLSQFFGVWGRELEREGYALKTVVDGEEVSSPAGIVFEDGQEIVLEYSSL